MLIVVFDMLPLSYFLQKFTDRILSIVLEDWIVRAIMAIVELIEQTSYHGTVQYLQVHTKRYSMCRMRSIRCRIRLVLFKWKLGWCISMRTYYFLGAMVSVRKKTMIYEWKFMNKNL